MTSPIRSRCDSILFEGDNEGEISTEYDVDEIRDNLRWWADLDKGLWTMVIDRPDFKAAITKSEIFIEGFDYE